MYYNNHENSKRRRKLSDLTNQFPPPPSSTPLSTPPSQLHHQQHHQHRHQHPERQGQGQQEKKDHLVVASPPPSPKRSKVTPSVVSIPRFVLARPTGIGVLAQTLVDISSYFNYKKLQFATEWKLYGEEVEPILPLSLTTTSNTWNNGNDLALLATEDGYLRLLDVTKEPGSGEFERTRWKAHRDAIFHAHWTSKGRILTASGDQSVCVWDVHLKRCISRLRGHTASVKCVKSNPKQPDVLATCGRDGNIFLWDLRTACSSSSSSSQDLSEANADNVRSHRPVGIIRKAHPQQKFEQGHLVVGVGGKGAKTRSQSRPLSQPAQSVSSLEFLQHRDHLLASAGVANGFIKYWDLRKHLGPSLDVWRTLPEAVQSSQFPINDTLSPPRGISWLCLDDDSGGEFIYATSTANKIYQYRADQLGLPEKTFSALEFEVNSFYIRSTLCKNGQFLLSGSSSGQAFIWNTTAKSSDSPPVRVLQAHEKDSCVAWNDPNRVLITGGDDSLIKIWR